jgi:hypothetical protein
MIAGTVRDRSRTAEVSAIADLLSQIGVARNKILAISLTLQVKSLPELKRLRALINETWAELQEDSPYMEAATPDRCEADGVIMLIQGDSSLVDREDRKQIRAIWRWQSRHRKARIAYMQQLESQIGTKTPMDISLLRRFDDLPVIEARIQALREWLATRVSTL